MSRHSYIMTTHSADRTGIVAALTQALATYDGFIHELAQYGTPSTENFFSRICFSVDDGYYDMLEQAIKSVCTQFDLQTSIIPKARKTRTLIMVSKMDHCLVDLLYRQRKGQLNTEITGVVSNHTTHRAMVEASGLPYYHVSVTPQTKAQSETRLRDIITDTNSELIILARYMQILSDKMCRDYQGRIINIHHSFLPSFKGAKPYHRAHARGVKLIGATAHYVTPDLDEGPIIEQAVARVDHTQTALDLVTVGRDVEAKTLAHAVDLHTQHRVFVNGRKTVILP